MVETRKLGACAVAGAVLLCTPTGATAASPDPTVSNQSRFLALLTYENTTKLEKFDYPVFVGYTFAPGAVPKDKCPHVQIDSNELTSKVDVKTRWKDASVQYANMYYAIPHIPPGAVPAAAGAGVVQVSFFVGDCGSISVLSKFPSRPHVSSSVYAQNMALPYMQFARLSGNATIFLTETK